MRTVYTNLHETTTLQRSIIKYMIYWVGSQKTPVPQKEIVAEMKRRDNKQSTIIYSLDGLLKLGYIRRAIVTPSNSTSYVLLRTA